MGAGARITTAIRFPDQLHEQLKQAADARGLSVNFIVVKAVEDFLERLVPPEGLRLTRVGGPLQPEWPLHLEHP